MPSRPSDGVAADGLRFLAAGAINTALTAAVYFLCLPYMSPTAAYAIAWLVGICFVMIVYPDRVFVGGRRTWRARLLFGALTLTVFLLGIVTLRWLVQSTGDARLAFLVTLVLTTALNFLGGRAISKGGVNAQE